MLREFELHYAGLELQAQMVSPERSLTVTNGSRKLTSHLFLVVSFALVAGQDHRRSTYRQGPSGCRVAIAYRADLPKQGQVRIGRKTRSEAVFGTCGGISIDDHISLARQSLDSGFLSVSFWPKST
jgi:hypothetical protein